jgi:putative chitinase
VTAPPAEPSAGLTLDQLLTATEARQLSDAKRYLQPLNTAMIRWGITTKVRQAAFLAQIGHESDGLYYNEEIASGAAYEGRLDLGNTQPGDGRRYKGRGLIQLTGRGNYCAARDGLRAAGLQCPDFEADPVAAGQAPWCVQTAGWFWAIKGCNTLAEACYVGADAQRLQAFKDLTKRINGGHNGLEDRLHLWGKAKSALGIA